MSDGQTCAARRFTPPQTLSATLDGPAPSAPSSTSVASSTSVTYNGGRILQRVTLRSVFLGAAWNSAPLTSLRQQIDAYLTYLVTSDVMTALAEYDVNGMTIGTGRHVSSTVLASVTTGATVDDTAIQNALTDAIGAGALQAPDANTLYVTFLPEGTSVTSPIGHSCDDFCGYHTTLANGAAYAVIPYPSCTQCQANGSVFDGLTCIVSHEFCESITNPDGDAWHGAQDVEIADLCATPVWKTRRSGSYLVQQIWSRTQGTCR